MQRAWLIVPLLLVACERQDDAALQTESGSPPAQEASREPAQPSVERRYVSVDQAAPGWGSPAVMAGSTLYLSAMRGAQPAGEAAADVGAETRQAMENLGATLRAAGLDYGNLVSCHVLLADMEDYQAMNAVYGGTFNGSYPARTTLEAAALPGGARVQVSCTAYADRDQRAIISPDPAKIPPAMGPYSPAIRAGDLIYVSGSGGRHPQTGEIAAAAGDQVGTTLDTISAILEAAGADLRQALTTQVYYLGDRRQEISEALAKRFRAGDAPVFGLYELGDLPGEIAVEITVVASQGAAINRLFRPNVTPAPLSSPGGLIGDTLYLAPSTAPEAGDDAAAQVRAAVEKQREILELRSLGLEHVVEVWLYLTDLADLEAAQGALQELFSENPPAVTVVGVNRSGDQGNIRAEVRMTAVR